MNLEQQSVIDAVKAMTQAVNEKNITQVLNSYEKNMYVEFEPDQSITDINTLEAMFSGAFAVNPQFTYPNGHKVMIVDQIAMHIAPWSMTGTTPDGQQVQNSGLSVSVLRKQKNGQWLLVIDKPHGHLLLS